MKRKDQEGSGGDLFSEVTHPVRVGLNIFALRTLDHQVLAQYKQDVPAKMPDNGLMKDVQPFPDTGGWVSAENIENCGFFERISKRNGSCDVTIQNIARRFFDQEGHDLLVIFFRAGYNKFPTGKGH